MRLKTTAIVAAIGLLLLLGGCSSKQYLVNDPKVLLAYRMDPNEGNLESLSKAYASAINQNRREGVKQPGLFADYAVTLALLDKREEANKWFNNEVAAFPTSGKYVNQLKLKLVPEYAEDTTTASEVTIEVEPAEADATAVDNTAVAESTDGQAAVEKQANADQPKAKSSKSKKGKKGHKKSKKSKKKSSKKKK